MAYFHRVHSQISDLVQISGFVGLKRMPAGSLGNMHSQKQQNKLNRYD